ncbi:uncharacterized protein LOC124355665 [Homalodisca vitripennis]|uniref:uncharacterized protein LOC124355665 n=1 Tax=Homalodisca vitripennis TaxID=197043 RepID=UPI001EE9BECC|nr:uncharacterized protein LOC124355665 [Homalodisca vitripennis]
MVPRHSMLIDSVKDIVLGNFLWGEPEYNNVSKRALYFNLEDPWQSQLENRFRNLTSDTSTAALRSGKFVFPVQRFGYSYVFIDVDGLETNDLREFRLMKQTLNEFYVSFKFSKQSPLLDVCYATLQRFFEVGLIEHWKKSVILKYGTPDIAILLRNHKTVECIDSFNPLTLSNNMVAFQFILGGLALQHSFISVVFDCEPSEE